MPVFLIVFSVSLLAYFDLRGAAPSATVWWMSIGCFAYAVVQGLISRSIEVEAHRAFNGAPPAPAAQGSRRAQAPDLDFSAIPEEDLPPPTEGELNMPARGA